MKSTRLRSPSPTARSARSCFSFDSLLGFLLSPSCFFFLLQVSSFSFMFLLSPSWHLCLNYDTSANVFFFFFLIDFIDAVAEPSYYSGFRTCLHLLLLDCANRLTRQPILWRSIRSRIRLFHMKVETVSSLGLILKQYFQYFKIWLKNQVNIALLKFSPFSGQVCT